jgi:hypothetical protein
LCRSIHRHRQLVDTLNDKGNGLNQIINQYGKKVLNRNVTFIMR